MDRPELANGLLNGTSLAELVEARGAELSRTERRVADYFAAHAQDLIFLSAVQLAALTDTSDATIIRTAKVLGFSGLPELKHSVGAQLLESTHPANRLASKITTVGGGSSASMLDAVIAEASDQLRETERLFAGDEFDRAVDIIDASGTVMTFGVGISKVVAEYLATRMNRVGIRADLAQGMGFALADDLLRLRKGDSVVIFAPGRLAHEVEVIIDHAKTLGLSLILITDTLHNQLKEQVDVYLRAPLSASRLTGELLSASIISDALMLALAKKRDEQATRSYKTLTSLRRRLIGRRR